MKTYLRNSIILAVVFSLQHVARANTALWIGNPGVTVTTNWSDNLNWNNVGGGTPGALQNDAKFGGTGSAGDLNIITSVVDVNQFPLSLQYSNVTQSGQFHHALIPAGVTLTVGNGNLTIGGITADNYRTQVKMSGGGTLLVTNGLAIGNNGTAGLNSQNLLDLSELEAFVFNASGGTIAMASGNRSTADFRMAAGSNYVTAATWNDNTASSSSSGTGNLFLGSGTNIINVGNFNIAGNRGSSTVSFPNSTGGLKIRGVGGTDVDRANMFLGNRNNGGGSGNSCSGTLSLDGHPVDIKLGNLTMGMSGSNPSGNAPGNGTITFDTGTIDVTNISMAICNGTTVGVQANGTITVGANATLIVGSGGISMANQNATSGAATGTLNVNNGTAQVGGNIRKTSTAGTANINVAAGKLTMIGNTNTVGTSVNPINNLNLTDSTLTIPALNATASIAVQNLTTFGTTDTVNVSSLPPILSYPTTFQLITYQSLNNFDFVLGTLPSTFQGYLVNSGNSVDLVVTNGPTTVRALTWRGTPGGDWDTSSLNWLDGVTPTFFNQNDAVVFNDSLSGTPNVNLVTNVIPSAMVVNNSSTSYVLSGAGRISGTATLSKQGSGSLTLAGTGGDDFSGGITVSGGSLLLNNANSAISGGLSITAGSVQVGNNDGSGALPSGAIANDGTLTFNLTSDVTVTTGISGSGALVKNSSGRLTLTGANSYSGNTTVNSGTLALTGTGSIASSAQVSVNAGFDVSGATGPTILNALSLNNAGVTVAMPNVNTPLNVTSLSLSGGNTINVTSLPPIASYPTTVTLIQSASGISGSAPVAGTLPAATPPYAGSISISADQLSVRLTLTSGPVSARPAVFWSGADAPNLNWSDAQNWLLPGAPNPTESAVFNQTATVGASAVTTPGGGASALEPANYNNIVDANFSISSLIYTNTGGTYHNTHLNNGRTLTMTNTLTVGAIDAGGTVTQEGVSISGSSATVNVNNSAANLQVWLGNQNVGNHATLDMSALDNFNGTLNRLTVGASAINNAVNRPSGTLYLAKTNTISAGFQTTTIEVGTTTGNAGIVVGDCNGNAGPASFLYLGQVNTISSDTIALARQKTTATMRFNPIYADIAPYPSVVIQGFSSSRVSVFDVGSGAGNTGTTTGTGTANFSGGIVNLMADTMNVGRASAPASGTSGGTTTGVLTFDAGTINVNTLNVGWQPAAFNNLKVGIGTVNVGTNANIGLPANLIVNGTMSLAVNAGNPATSGTLNINGGNVQAGNIVVGVNGAPSTISLIDGSLSAGTIGSSTAPLGTLNLTGGSLQLNLDGSSGSPSLVATTINMGGTTALKIGSIANVATNLTYPLISYTGANPFSALTLVSLPPYYVGTLVDDSANSLIGITFTKVAITPPTIGSVSVNGGSVSLSGSGGPANGSYVVLTSTNAALPLASWTRTATNNFDASGNFNYSTPVNPLQPTRFFSIVIP